MIIRLILVMMVLPFFGLNATASSVKCTPPLDGPFGLVKFTGSNGIKLSSSLPVGKTVFNQNYTVHVWCSISDPLQQDDEMAMFIRRTTLQTLGNGLTLFTTLNGDRGSDDSIVSTGVMINNHEAAKGLPPRTWQYLSLNVTVDIVKTGKTPDRPEQVTPISSQISLFQIGSQGGNNAEYTMLDAASGLSFIAHSCQIQGPASFNVPLGPVRTRRDHGLGSGIGTTSAGKSFSLNFLCDSEVSGDFTVLMQLNGTAPAGATAPGLLALSEDANSATGVALQILHADSTIPVTLGQPWQIASYPLTVRTISVPLLVRYYQTSERITPGKANGIMTWVLNYL